MQKRKRFVQLWPSLEESNAK